MALYEVYCDGASRGQGASDKVLGEGACAIVIYKNNRLWGQYARGLGKVTNNQAEYEGVLLGIMACWFADLPDPIIYSDSTLVVNQVNKVWQPPKLGTGLRHLLLSIFEIREEFRFRVMHRPRTDRGIAQADLLAKQFLDKLLHDQIALL
ncbi:MAG TPA: reverse transcriptase-like protein [Nitrososphaera sp.]|nr:reverse transcriptase-like protein [Nitrososphaera sp.]